MLKLKITRGYSKLFVCTFRHAKGASGPPEDSRDIFSGHHDPNALKVQRFLFFFFFRGILIGGFICVLFDSDALIHAFDLFPYTGASIEDDHRAPCRNCTKAWQIYRP